MVAIEPFSLYWNALGGSPSTSRRIFVAACLPSCIAGAGPTEVALESGEPIASETLVWAAGVRPSDLAGALDVTRSRGGRVQVDEALRVRRVRDVYAIGDVASVMQDGREVPMLSAPAMQEGRHAATNILRAVESEPPRAFQYKEKGSMATIGRNDAVAQLGPIQLTGFLGWLMWLVVHLYYLIGFRNRLVVLMGWAWNYVRLDRPVRIVTRARERPRQD
jgi:NADH:ubiquinone reductase (H+-translocating)